jgi:hypothetical protein
MSWTTKVVTGTVEKSVDMAGNMAHAIALDQERVGQMNTKFKLVRKFELP